MSQHDELKRLAEHHRSLGHAYTVATPAAVLALIAEIQEYKAMAEQPASLNAVPATEYSVLKRQFFALRNYALCKDKLSGHYSRELEKLRGVDRSQSADEIDAERDINEQLTNDLLTVETERDQLKAENERLESEAVYSAAGFDAAREEITRLKAENEIFEEGMRALASTLGAGGYNADTLTSTQLVEKVQWGVDHLAETSARIADDLRPDAERYRFVSQLAWYVDQAAYIYDIGNAQSPWAGERAPVDADDVESAIDAAMGKGEQS